MNFSLINEKDNHKECGMKRFSGRRFPSAIGDGLLAGDRSAIASEVEFNGHSGVTSKASNRPFQYPPQWLNAAGSQWGFDDIKNQMIRRAVADYSTSVGKERTHPVPSRDRSFYEHEHERTHSTQGVLSHPFRSHPLLTAQSSYGPQQAWHTSDNEARNVISQGNNDKMKRLLLHQRDQIRQQTQWVDALQREVTRRRAREGRHEGARQGTAQGVLDAYSVLPNGRTLLHDQHSIQGLPTKRQRQYYDNLSSTQAAEPLRSRMSDRTAEPPMSSSMCETLRGKTPDLAEQSYRRPETEASHTNARRTSTEVTGPGEEERPQEKAKPRDGLSLQLSRPHDKGILSDYQRLTRESIELFEIQPDELLLGVQGRRNTCIEAGQVGLRCRHCKNRPPHWRGQGAVYFPGTLRGVYQACQNMSANHFLKSCTEMPPALREEFITSREKQLKEARRSGGITYWAKSCEALGVEERPNKKGLWFCQQ